MITSPSEATQALAAMSSVEAAAAIGAVLDLQTAADGRVIQALVIDMKAAAIEIWLSRLPNAMTYGYYPENVPDAEIIRVKYSPGITVDAIHLTVGFLLPGTRLYLLPCSCCSYHLESINICDFCLTVDACVNYCPAQQPDEPDADDNPRLVAYRVWAAGYTARQKATTPELLETAMEVYMDPGTAALWRMGFEAAEWDE